MVSPLNKCRNVLLLLNKIINKHHLLYLLEVWGQVGQFVPMHIPTIIYICNNDLRIQTMYCKHYVNLHGGILQKITNRTDCSYFHKKEITGEYIYSGSVHSENLPNQK